MYLESILSKERVTAHKYSDILQLQKIVQLNLDQNNLNFQQAFRNQVGTLFKSEFATFMNKIANLVYQQSIPHIVQFILNYNRKLHARVGLVFK